MKRAVSDATHRSLIATMTTPAPITGPLTAVMIGFDTGTPTFGTACQNCGGGSLRSAPATKISSPAAVRMATRSSSLAAKRCHAAYRSAHIADVKRIALGRPIDRDQRDAVSGFVTDLPFTHVLVFPR